jgi:hypothetical protein
MRKGSESASSLRRSERGVKRGLLNSSWWPTIFLQARALLDLSPEDVWLHRRESYRTLCVKGSRLEILRRRLASDLPHPDEIQAAHEVPELIPELRALVQRLLRDPERAWRLALAVEGLPSNDAPTRSQGRLRRSFGHAEFVADDERHCGSRQERRP